MDPATRASLGAQFERAADTYAASRPTYPAASLSWLAGATPSRVLDLGAGSGALTHGLVAAGHQVFAAELSASMLSALTAALPATPAVQSRAESLPFPRRCFDRVTVATAFHWFDPGPALAEIAAVLRPGGWLSLAWASRDEQPGWTRQLGDLLRDAQPAGLTGDWGEASSRELVASALFGPEEYAEFGFIQNLDRNAFLGLLASRSYVIASSRSTQAELRRSASAIFDQAASDNGYVSLPYRLKCWRAPVISSG